MFSLSPVEFRQSAISGRGVFAKRAFEPGEIVVAYAPKQTRLRVDDPAAGAAAESKLTLLSEGFVLVPDTRVPGGWLCNHSCNPNAAIFSSGEGRIQCTRRIARGDEVTIFYGWVTESQAGRDPCACGADNCRGFINFDVTPADASRVAIIEAELTTTDDALRQRLDAYGEYLRTIGQEHVTLAIATTLARIRARNS